MRTKEAPKGKISEDWEVVEIGQLGEVVTGTTPSTKLEEYWKNGTYMFVTPTDFNGKKYIVKTERKVTQKSLEKARLVPKNSVMVVCIASVGEVALATEDCTTNQQINTIICKEEIDPEYLYYTIKNSKSRLIRWAGITTSPIIKKSSFEKFPLALPKYPEQKSISSVLSTVDSAIQKVDEIIAKTERLKKGLMQRLLTKGIGHKEFKDTEIGRIPKEWEVVKIGDVLDSCQYGLSVKMGETGRYPIIKMDDILNGRILPDKIKYTDTDDKNFNDFRLEKGDILFNRTNSYELVGRTGIFLLDGDYLFASYLIRLKPKKDIIDSQFLTFSLISLGNKIRQQLATRAVHQANINAANLQKFKIRLPPLSEQQKISEILSAVDEKLELERKRKGKLERVKKGLMNDLLIGRKRVKI